MPRRALRPCGHPGCRALVPGGAPRCDRHRAQYQAERAVAQQYYDSAWRAVRRRFLERYPACEGYGCPHGHARATEVDHIVAVSQAPELRLRWSNLRAFCASCHSRRTATEQVGT
jgi:5-methylcytosine-specific restriction protein A